MTATADAAGFADDCAELGELWPQLREALTKDTGTGPGAVVTFGSVPFNGDVMRAITELSAQVPVTTVWAAERAGEVWQPRPVPVCLRALPRFHERLLALGTSTAEVLAADVRRWRRLAKLALRLIDPSWDLPPWVVCTAHETPVTRLRHVGAERAIVWDGEQPRTVLVRDGYFLCDHCGARWLNGQWEMLIAALIAPAGRASLRVPA